MIVDDVVVLKPKVHKVIVNKELTEERKGLQRKKSAYSLIDFL